MPESLSCAFYRAHGKERICRVSTIKHMANNKHAATMLFVVCQPLAHGERGVSPCVNPQAHGEHGSRGLHTDSAVKGLTVVIVCRVPESGTRQTQIFTVCHMSGTRRTLFCRHAPSRALTDVIICRVCRVTHGKHGPLPCAWP